MADNGGAPVSEHWRAPRGCLRIPTLIELVCLISFSAALAVVLAFTFSLFSSAFVFAFTFCIVVVVWAFILPVHHVAAYCTSSLGSFAPALSSFASFAAFPLASFPFTLLES